MPKQRMIAAILFTSTMFLGSAQAQQNFDKVEIRTEKLSPTTYVLFGTGGNIGVSYGEDGTILIDDQFAPLTAKIQTAVAALGANCVAELAVMLTVLTSTLILSVVRSASTSTHGV